MNQATQALLPTRITVDNANTVYVQLQQLGMLQEGGLVVDLSTVTHCDSAGVAALIEVKSEHAARQQQVNYTNPSQQLRDLARFLKVDAVLFGM